MAALLAFLLGVALFVYQWFGPEFPAYFDRVFNFWVHLAQKAAETLHLGIQIAQGLVNLARAYALYLFENASNLLEGAKALIWNWIVSQVNSARGFATWLFNTLVAWVQGQLAGLQTWIDTQVASVRAWAQSLFQAALGLAQALIAPFLPYLALLKSLQALFTADNLNKLTHLLGSFFDSLILFLSNPGAFIIGVLWPKFADLLCYALAVGLGATQETIPGPPDWGKPK